MARSKLVTLLPALFGQAKYLIQDNFTTPRAVTAINGTPAEPGPGVRTVVDGEALDYLGSSYMTWPTAATPSNADDNIGYFDRPITRRAGRTFYGTVRLNGTSGNMYPLIVLNSATPNWVNNHDICMVLSANQMGVRPFNSTAIATIQNVVPGNLDTHIWIMQRATGNFIFMRLGNSGYPKLRWTTELGTTATTYLGAANYNGTQNTRSFRVKDVKYTPAPMASDTFNRAAIGNTDGLAHAEANGGGGLAWADKVGTVGISASTVAIASAVAGGIAIATVDGTSPDGLFEIVPTKGTTGAGLCLRYVDADNYLYCYHDGTNLVFIKRVAGVESDLRRAAAAGGNTKRLRVLLDGTTAYAFYNDARIGEMVTVPASTSVKHGLYFADTDSTQDTFIGWPLGTEGQHSAMNAIAVDAPASIDPVPPGSFTIAVLPDTQEWSDHYPDHWTTVCNYIATHKDRLNTQLVLHVGDVVGSASVAAEWAAAEAGLAYIDAANLPYLVAIGNHDYESYEEPRAATVNFHTHFPQSRYTGKSWWAGGFYAANRTDNSYLLITIDGTDYIILNLESGPRDAVLTWADALLTTYATRKAIILTHTYMNSDDSRLTTGDTNNPHGYWTDTHDGQEMWDELVKLHDNVILVDSGHQPGVGDMTSNSNGGQAVIQLLFDFQAYDSGNNAYIQYLIVNPTAETIKQQTFDCHRTDANALLRTAGQYEFTYSY